MGDLYGRVMPSSKKQLNDKTEKIKKDIHRVSVQIEKISSNVEQIQEESESTSRRVEQIYTETDRQDRQNKDLLNLLLTTTDNLDKKLDLMDQKIDKLTKAVDIVDKLVRIVIRSSDEEVWSSVFHDAIAESSWLKKKTFYPGRWAAGYQYLYVLYRTLNDFRPTSILELGLGQTTRVLGQYAACADMCHHTVVEHDQEWIDIFNKDFELSRNTEIAKLDIAKKVFDDTEPTTVYVGFAERFKGQKFDLISIDAPFGGIELTYARMDILQLLPDCLKEDFVILLDDYNRQGEKNMVELMKKILQEHDIKFNTGVYRGNKDTFMITSENLRFLCTM